MCAVFISREKAQWSPSLNLNTEKPIVNEYKFFGVILDKSK